MNISRPLGFISKGCERGMYKHPWTVAQIKSIKMGPFANGTNSKTCDTLDHLESRSKVQKNIRNLADPIETSSTHMLKCMCGIIMFVSVR